MKKQIIAGMAAAMVCVGAVGGTFAYLTQTTEVTNTFTVGENVGITLDEADVNELGERLNEDGTVHVEGDEKELADRVTENKYKLIPGRTYVKDPTVTVNENTADCYVFIHVENGISGIEGEDDTIATQIADNWTSVDGRENYYYWAEGTVSAGRKLNVFETFTVDGEKEYDDLEECAGATITITACAVQADGFANAAEAAVALPADF